MINVNKAEFTFRYFFNPGYDARTNECDLEGSEVYHNGHYIGSVPWVEPDELEDMDEDEFFEKLAENYIIY